MAKTIFGKRTLKKCEICIHSSYSNSSEKIICEKKGLVERDNKCMRFKYDPFKRTPAKTSIYGDVTEEDFKL